MTRVSNCYICGEQFDSNELSTHEKSCLERIISNDVQYTRKETKENGPSSQFETCHLCGKLYSKHSMDIHLKQCEKTRAMQRNMGTVAESKTKCRGLTDMSEGKSNFTRIPISKPSSRIPVRRAGSSPGSSPGSNKDQLFVPPVRGNRPKSPNLPKTIDNLTIASKKDRPKSPNLPKKNDNLTIASKKDEPVGEAKLKLLSEDKPAFKKDKFNLGESNQASTPSSGLHKCYMCGQLYGVRSLPIHEKQCYAKCKRTSEEKKTSKRGGVPSFSPSKYRDISAASVVQPAPM